MKKSLFFTITLFSLLLASCGSDDGSSETPTADLTANLQPVGSSARDFLTSETFNSLIIDIVFVEGFRPTDATIDNIINFLEERTFKPGGIEVQFTSIPRTGKDEFTIQEVAEIEKENRSLYNDGDQLALYIFFADADSENTDGNSAVIGAAYRNTSLVIYENTILKLANNSVGITRTTIESAVLNHELSHAFGLVDLGTPLQSDHLDVGNGNHCNVPSCLMEFQIDFANNAMGRMAGNIIPQLDPLCIADLQANGGR